MELNHYFPLFVIVLLVLLLIGLVGLWVRQTRIMQQLQDNDRLEQQLRELERLVIHEATQGREDQGERSHQLQQRVLTQIARLYQALERRFGEMRHNISEDSGGLRAELIARFDSVQQQLMQSLSEERVAQQEGLTQGLDLLSRQLGEGLSRHAEELGKRVDTLTESTDQRLQQISGQVEKRLSEGFEKTTETFTRVLEHLSRIDEAQKRITELSTNVVSLQEVLSDKRSRGAFGEVQLTALVRNLLPENSFSLQHTLSNGTRVDCLLFLPEPTGNVAVDAKFPLESYQRLTDHQLPEMERQRAAQQFRQDIRKHIQDIASKYILAGETSDGAVMFLPSESVFAEIHSHFPELVEEAYSRRVWLVSPTTMMAILTTARAVLKDAATREQVHVIQQHLGLLSKDFGRFQDRMDRLAKHIHQAQKDVDEVNLSARKISDRFHKIEKVELDEQERLESPGTD